MPARFFTSSAPIGVCGWVLLLPLAVVICCVGCDMRTRDRVMDFKPDPIEPAKAILRAYAAGQPVGSESETFDSLVARVSEATPEKGKLLQEFFGKVQRTGKVVRGDAKKLLEKLE
ncbi:MAG: hypothetical protein RLZZ622_969 [Planctomycetota bacterium]|jgi:hypothetical protein